MDINKALFHIYQNIQEGKDFMFKNEGEGAYISEWKYDKPQPTEAELTTAWDEIMAIPSPPSELDKLKKQQADLMFELMMKGVI